MMSMQGFGRVLDTVRPRRDTRESRLRWLSDALRVFVASEQIFRNAIARLLPPRRTMTAIQ